MSDTTDHEPGAEASLSNKADDAIRQRTAQTALNRAALGIQLTSANLPWLSGLARRITLSTDERIPVAAVTATGRVLVNPNVFAVLPIAAVTFIVAHELLHLALDTFSRQSSYDDRQIVNIAHDYIINDILRNELQMSPPLGGLDLPGASSQSLEQIVARLNSDMASVARTCWTWTTSDAESSTGSGPTIGGIISHALRDAGLIRFPHKWALKQDLASESHLRHFDVIPRELEQELFPNEPRSPEKHIEQVRRESVKSLSLRSLAQKTGGLFHRGSTPGRARAFVTALRQSYVTPWEVALQRWMETVAPGQRTYARPSRRGADRSDCIRPGQSREGWTIHLVLDTSGSMATELPRVLGAIAMFCQNVSVTEVHILQCDTEVTVDEWVPVEDLEEYCVTGLGGSDMSPAMHRLAPDLEVTAVIVITDGMIHFPAEEMPYQVLWVLIGHGNFVPSYGEVLRLADDRNDGYTGE